MSSPQKTLYPVSKPLWDSLESALLARSKDLIRDIAKSLHVPDKTLMDAFRKKKHDCYLVDLTEPTNETFLCQALVPCSNLAVRCRKATIYGDRFCPEHCGWQCPKEIQNKPILRRIIAEDDIYYVDNMCQIYDTNYNRIGKMKEKKCIIFEVES